ncbi:lactate utilization protein C [Neisseria leonii]|uniref:Lactate utilization protein C n=1 Tax=Neisseria leonii TaxID=2995413 RepID=A0A9X4E0Y0_9NEIS|nr:lactate utilization protein C [Neisseria sp. 51.81]MDD9327396.1 lactate utilization protein C [Neisseria sp. 51.81]
MSARENILAKLRRAAATPAADPQTAAYYREMTPHWDSETGRLKHWARAMRAVKTEIYWVRADNWTQTLVRVLQEKKLRNILLPLTTGHGRQAAGAVSAAGIEVKTFDQPIENWKDRFFADTDAGFTDARCGIAHTGTLMLWPSEHQPRSMSLVPPVHICLFDTATMYDDFYSAMQGENMAAGMPANVVLVSGPSKTADIQLTLAYGAHGPRDMVVLALLPEHIGEADLTE